MKKKSIVIIGLIILIIILLTANYFGFLFSLNKIFPQNPDLSCKIDSDCRLQYPGWSECNLCGSCTQYDVKDNKVIAVNKNWRPFCPLKRPSIYCVKCFGLINGPAAVKCIDNKCQKILE